MAFVQACVYIFVYLVTLCTRTPTHNVICTGHVSGSTSVVVVGTIFLSADQGCFWTTVTGGARQGPLVRLGGTIFKFILTLSIIHSVIVHHVMYHCTL